MVPPPNLGPQHFFSGVPHVIVSAVTHFQKKQLTPLHIFISVIFELSLDSWIPIFDDDIHWSELFPLRVHLLH